jgi:integrase
MAGKRSFGSVRKRGRTWEASYWKDGRRHVAPSVFTTKTEALEHLSSVQTAIARNAWVDASAGRVLFEVIAAHWFVSNPAKRESTLAREEVSLRLHIIPSLGRTRLDQVSPHQIQQLVNEWALHRAARSVRRDYDVVRAILSYAVSNDWLARSPCRNIRLPAVGRSKRHDLTPDDVAKIAESLPDRYRPMVWVGGVLGLRWSEVIGLKVGSLDLESGTLTVAESITRGFGGQLVTGPPKSSAGNRTVTLPTTMADLLAEHLSSLGAPTDTDALVFTNTEGAPIRYDNWRRRVWMPATRAAGCEGAGFHDLRRLAATSLVLSGVDIKTAQVRLGHSDPRLTLSVYAAAPPEADRSAADRLESRFFGTTASETDRRSDRAKIAPKRAKFAAELPKTRSSGGRNPR